MQVHKITKKAANHFQKALYAWAMLNPRPMPWKGEKDPYKIWLSEIILQQTRVEQGLPYFQRFIKAFPTVHDLAKSPLQKVLKLWEGLGYYTRARNLHHSAQYIVDNHKGVFPDTFDSIKQLKGVGEYSASAIASFAYDLPYAVLDGNVHRILARFFGISTILSTSDGKKLFKSIADLLLDPEAPARYNQAIMDFGALCCIPKAPLCSHCPLQKSCFAYVHKMVDQYPTPKKRIEKKIRYFHYFVLLDELGNICIQQRLRGDIWAELFEFPMIENQSTEFPSSTERKSLPLKKVANRVPNLILTQVLSHQVIKAYVYFYKISSLHPTSISIPSNKLYKIPMPGLLAKNRKSILKIIESIKALI